MKKLYFFAALVIAAICSCTSETNHETEAGKNKASAISFGVYTERSRATNDITTTVELANANGFGVLAYEHGTTPFYQHVSSTIIPNFMQNEHIYASDANGVPAALPVTDVTAWGYAPVKYWPNEEGARISFFAYAPYQMQVMTQTYNPHIVYNSSYGAPAIQYTMPTDLSKGIDLQWASAIDQTRGGITDKITFNFKHALSKITFNVQAWVDELTDNPDCNPNGTNTLAENTTIVVKNVRLVGMFAKAGILSLADGIWYKNETSQEFVLPISNIKLDNTNSNKEQSLFSNNESLLMIPGTFQIQVEYDVVTVDPKLPNGKSVVTNVITSDDQYTANAGYSYGFHLNLGMVSTKFDVTTVEGWTNDGNKEVDTPNNH